MKFKPIQFSSFHVLQDNGVGDYELLCPESGRVGFAHLGIALLFCACPKTWCWSCKRPIGAVTSGELGETEAA